MKTPRHSLTKVKTPVMESEDLRKLLDSLPLDTVVGLRDRALIGTMVYTSARVGAVVKMKVGDFYLMGRRSVLRLKEKGAKDHEVPAHLKLGEYRVGCRFERLRQIARFAKSFGPECQIDWLRKQCQIFATNPAALILRTKVSKN